MTYQRIIKGLIAIGIFIMIIMPGYIFELLIEFFHLLLELFMELLHICFEWIESTLDHLVEHLFETDTHDTQIIVFYILMTVLAIVLYRLYLFLPKVVKQIYQNILVYFTRLKIRLLIFWEEQSLLGKIKYISVSVGVLYIWLFLSV
jgi:hypothetical protein